MKRLLMQVRSSDFPQKIGLCQADRPSVAAAINDITERLVYAGGDSGWWGGWSRVLFSVTKAAPYITLPPQFCRIINLTVCKIPLRVQNEFYEMMEASIGLQPPSGCADWCGALEGFERGTFSTFVDLPTDASYTLRIYPTNQADVGTTMLFSGAKDQNGNGIYTIGTEGNIIGLPVVLQYPFVDTLDAGGNPLPISGWSAISKDKTYGDVVLAAVNTSTGVETVLSRYLPWETNPSYRRYYINALPSTCCNTTGSVLLNVEAMCKKEFVPISQDTDELLISNLPALIEESQAQRAMAMEDPGAGQRYARHHALAIKLLQDEMVHYLGRKQPAINFAPFGTARLARQAIGRLR